MDRITRVRIKNVRAIEALDLEISRPLTVLIGENGAGKSTIIECLEILRKAAESSFLARLYAVHRGLPALLRKGASSMELGVGIEDDEGLLPNLEYSFALASRGAGAIVEHERVSVGVATEANSPMSFFRQSGQATGLYGERQDTLGVAPKRPDGARQFSLTDAPVLDAMDRVVAALRGIEVHLPFDTCASWAARSHQRPESLRASTTHFPADRLNLLGFNLANAWSELRGREAAHWEHSLALARLGLGERLDTVLVTPDYGGGNIYLALRFKDLAEPIFASDLSDGQLSWLAFVAMARLNTSRTLLAMDEPELHMHPALLGRVVSLLANLEGGSPVLLSTHSDRVLELLDDPVSALRVLDLHDGRANLSRLDADELPRWLEAYGDIGQLRTEGYLPRVLYPVREGGSGSGDGR